MTYLHTPYIDSSSYSLYAELSTELPADPEIKRSDSPTSTADSWPVSRYLTDKSPFPLYSTMDSITSGAVAPFPPAHFQRPGSPSYTNSSSTCSSTLSPPRETDYCQVRSPPTPSDAPLLSPYESWSSHPQVYQFTGLADGCVNLGDVNPMQDLPISYYDDDVRPFGFPARTCSMSSDDSNTSHTVWNEDEVSQHARGLSADPTDIKEEICIPDTVERGHTFLTNDTELLGNPGSPYLKTEPTEDEEDENKCSQYKKPKNGSPKSIRATKSQKRRSTSQSSSDAKRPKTAIEGPLVVRTGNKPPIQGTKGQFPCPDCLKVSFKDRTGLENHIKKQHTRPFTCIFEFAGCRSTFASKNEWKRHCASQHIVLQYWVCQQDGCAQVSNRPNIPKKSSGATRKRADCTRYPIAFASPLPNGTIFNRKDLYTQHLRRMHVPAHLKNKVKSKAHVPEWEEQQRVHQDEAVRIRCQLPTHMSCPAPSCNMQFDGTNAWDELGASASGIRLPPISSFQAFTCLPVLDPLTIKRRK
ncbi:hypothetical protein NUW58_g7882 [Xylaria curta]|uniref:Uncharacterized protein n=1 Tax=Xylaria curta TaxID=42375 RepID=A0ACC1NFQ3_9PEZI|nr:hypothetical protein NUW58_g7882 [Xylaria curta]